MNNPWVILRGFVSEPSALSIEAQQKNWLHSLLKRNAETKYGRQCAFESIESIEDYQKAVPLTDYESLEPLILEMKEGALDILFKGSPVAFEYTGGSSGGSKLIPYSPDALADFRCALLPWMAEIIVHYEITSGQAYFALSPALNRSEFTDSGIPIGGGDFLYLGEEAAPLFMQISAVPLWVSELASIDDWKLATLYWLLRADDLRLMSVWSPSFLWLLLDGIEAQQEALLSLFEQGGEVGGFSVESFQAAFIKLNSFLANDQRDYKILWPNLCLISCWADAGFAASAKKLKSCFPDVCIQGKGLLSTESVVSVPNMAGATLLAVNSGFFEFIDESGQIHLAHELKPSCQYEVVVTTASGFYRYQSKDMVRCMGHDPNTELPILKFMGRAGVVSDLVGEKLTENFVLSCFADIEGFCMLIPIKEPNGYVLLTNHTETEVDDLALKIEQRLSQNPQYAYARKLGQLAPLKVQMVDRRLPETLYLEWATKQNRKLGDIKIPALFCPPVNKDGEQSDWKKIFSIEKRRDV